jgi:hypothetical protein
MWASAKNKTPRVTVGDWRLNFATERQTQIARTNENGIPMSPSARSSNKANPASTNRRRRYGIKSSAAVVMAGLLVSSVAPAQDGPRGEFSAAIPGSIGYIFDLPWCAKWELSCQRCDKRNGSIVCERTRESCQETFNYYYCAQFNLPPGCFRWRDGCNSCVKGSDGRISCTLAPCQEYQAPNRPSFVCLSFRDQ